jgi:hypothetical protein
MVHQDSLSVSTRSRLRGPARAGRLPVLLDGEHVAAIAPENHAVTEESSSTSVRTRRPARARCPGAGRTRSVARSASSASETFRVSSGPPSPGPTPYAASAALAPAPRSPPPDRPPVGGRGGHRPSTATSAAVGTPVLAPLGQRWRIDAAGLAPLGDLARDRDALAGARAARPRCAGALPARRCTRPRRPPIPAEQVGRASRSPSNTTVTASMGMSESAPTASRNRSVAA